MSIEVSDDRAGIGVADQGLVFDPFFRTRLELGGSGLGLSVAPGVVPDHAGAVDLVSRPKKGTRVIVRLPLTPRKLNECAGFRRCAESRFGPLNVPIYSRLPVPPIEVHGRGMALPTQSR